MAVHDRQLNAFMRPFVAQSVGQATRSFRDEVNNPGSDLNKHPEDYALYKLAEFDENNGHINVLHEGPLQVALASNLIERKRD